MYNLKGRISIVTGGARGLGKAMAERLGKEGATVVIADIDVPSMEKTVAEMNEAGYPTEGYRIDLTKTEEIDAMIDHVAKKYGRIDILINNAGIMRDKTFAKMDPADFELVLRVHLLGAAFATKACWETMREQNYGRVLMVTSSTGLGGNFGQ